MLSTGYPYFLLMENNESPDCTTNIVPGQALLIPLNEYTVQPNDTYAVIAGKAYVYPYFLLMENNESPDCTV
jgi:spore germination protein YaaH